MSNPQDFWFSARTLITSYADKATEGELREAIRRLCHEADVADALTNFVDYLRKQTVGRKARPARSRHRG